MRAVVLQQMGEAPRFMSFRDPEPRAGEVLVRVCAAVIRPADLAIARGLHACMPLELPYVCGSDGVGYLADGQRVYFRAERSPFGAMAEFVPAHWTVPVPDEVESAPAAALVGPAVQAWLPLAVRADLAPGETVLILGAAGLAARLAVQAARLQGAARVIVVGHRIDLAHVTGADAMVDLAQPPATLQQAFAGFALEGIDVVVDFLWGEVLELLLAALVQAGGPPASARDHGTRIVTVADRRMAPSVLMAPSALRDSRAVVMGCGPASYPLPEDLRLLVEDVLGCMREGHLSVDAEQMAMQEVAAAWRRVGETGQRVVLTLE
ncbi:MULTISPECIES: zinc-binding alcohol dehydrogenase family protein [Cupriavidus]|uniref:Zinc-binding alcohol dehydrogenase family protein n=1 Tax=Cupriavidus pauculus TaxID=82633 RepID=A0A3G8GYT1_9BURK|nr:MULTISPECIES: zinc-binding alcohol dehydrogenase family protein [Cupriavidus]AZG13383.1 zinc-binding alcohol dehydrogenase family protein [Cupriavidus pauculus]MDT6960608.1 zinc-binding alcohol dehydrogenase family protein [Cupriavidus sp. SZY C1]